jgi:hypothetical protein
MFAPAASSILRLIPFTMAGLAMFFVGCTATGSSRIPAAKFGLFPWSRQPAATAASQPTKKPRRTAQYNWRDEKVPGRRSISIKLSEQRAYFLKGNTVIGETDISTGRAGYATPPGNYRVIQKHQDHRSTLYGDFVDRHGNVVQSNADLTKQRAPKGTRFLGAKMPYFLRFYAGYGLHAGYLPGRPASHGCVRLPLVMAQRFYENAPLGTPVAVLP